MNFKDSITDLENKKPISHADACIWLGVLTNDWSDAPTRGHLEKKIMRQSLVFLRDYRDMDEIEFMKPDLIETLDHKMIPNFGEIFKDEEKFLKYSILAIALEHKRLNKKENKILTGDEKRHDLAARIFTDPKEIHYHLKEAAISNRIEKYSVLNTLKDEAAILFNSKNSTEAAHRRLYSEAFAAVVDNASPITLMKNISIDAAKNYDAVQALHVGQGRSRHPAQHP